MVNLSSPVNSLVLALIAIHLVCNEAGKIATKLSTDGNSSAVATSLEVHDEKLTKARGGIIEVESSEVETDAADSINVEAREAQQGTSTKYSWFYVAAWEWHIPLYFTLWFSFYVFWNVIRSILGHTVS